MDTKELLGFLECEKMERFQKVDSSVKVDCHDFAAAKQAKRSFFRKSRNDKVGGVDCHATATAAARNDSKQLTQTLLAMTIKRR